MAGENEINLELLLAIKDAVSSLNKFEKEADSTAKSVAQGFDFLKAAAAAAVAVFAGRAVINFFEEAIAASSEQEQAVQRLNTALATNGDYSEAASQAMQDYATQLQATTNISDDLIVNQLAIAKSFGISNAEAEKLVTAAADLSAITGTDLDTAVKQLGGTLQGTAGALGKTIPGIKGLTEEALKSGEAIDLIATKYKGAAAALTGTFAGAVSGVKVRFGELQETIGGLITSNPLVIAAITKIGGVLDKLQGFLKGNSKEASDFITKGLLGFLKAIPDVLKVFATFVDVLGFVAKGFVGLLNIVDDAIDLFTGALAASLLIVIRPLTKLIDLLGDKVPPGLANGIKEVDNALQATIDGVKENLAGPKLLQGVGETFDNIGVGIRNVGIASKDLAIDVENSASKQVKANKEVLKSINDVANAQEKLLTSAEVKDQITRGIDQPLTAQVTANIKEIQFEEGSQIPQAIGQVAGILSSVLKGAAGATEIIAKSLGAIAEAYLPGLGKVVSEIITVLAQGPEEVVKRIRDFNAEVPKILQNIIEAIPAIIIELLGNADKFIDSILDAVFKIIPALIESSPELVKAFFKFFTDPGIGVAIVKGIIAGTKELAKDPEFISSLGAAIISAGSLGFDQVIKDFFAQMGQGFVDLFNLFRENGFATFGILFDRLKEQANRVLADIGSELKKMGDDVINFFKALPAQIKNFFTTILPELSRTIVTAFREAFVDLKNFLVSLPQSIANEVKKAFDEFRKSISPGGTNGFIQNSTTNPLGTFSNLGATGIKFASGGQVPAGYPNDSAKTIGLTSGELIVPNQTTQNLFRLIDNLANGGGSGPQQIQIVLQIGEKQLADVMVDINRLGYRTTAV